MAPTKLPTVPGRRAESQPTAQTSNETARHLPRLPDRHQQDQRREQQGADRTGMRLMRVSSVTAGRLAWYTPEMRRSPCDPAAPSFRSSLPRPPAPRNRGPGQILNRSESSKQTPRRRRSADTTARALRRPKPVSNPRALRTAECRFEQVEEADAFLQGIHLGSGTQAPSKGRASCV